MDLRKTLKYAGLFAGVAAAAFGGSDAKAVGPWSEDGSITFTMTEPTAVPLTGDVNFGTAGVFSKVGSVGKLTIKATDGTVDETNAGTAPNTRFFKISYASADVLTFTVSGGVALADMSFKIGEADPNTANALTGADITVTNGVANNGTFIVDNWTCGIPDGGNNFKGAAAGGGGGGAAETLTGFSSVTGAGTLKLGHTTANAQINNGVAKVVCGMDIKTDNLGNPYPSGAYTGAVRVVIDYL